MLSGYRPALVVGIICGAILSVLYFIALSTPYILILLLPPFDWLLYFGVGALGVISDVRSYRQAIRALVAGAVSGVVAGLMWSMVSLTLTYTGMFLFGSAHGSSTSGVFATALWDVAGAFTETTLAAVFGAAGGMACLIVMAEVQRSPD